MYTKNYLVPHHSRTARFYLLPKIHKPGNPGKPIVSSCGAPTERISQFVDYYLHPLVTRVPSYIQDTTDFLVKLKQLPSLPDATLLATLDVSSLYTNIPHQEGITACEEALNSRAVQEPPTGDLCHLIKLILTRNNFSFNCNHYLQIQGTAMGTRMAPSYSNIFMGRLEQKLLKNQSQQPMVWWRYIDDIFIVWTHGETSLQALVDNLNTSHVTIKFTASRCTKEVAFLDTRVYLYGGKIETDLYVKPTDTHQYLLPTSCHPRHCKESIPYSQALRLRSIRSKEETYQTRIKEMKKHFLQRGYKKQILESQFKKVAWLTRDETLHHHEREKGTKPLLVTTFDPRQPPLGEITKHHHNILQISDKMQKAVPELPLIAYRRPKNLWDLLVRAELTPRVRQEPGTRRCGRRGCKTCPMLQTMDSITSHNGNTHRIRTSALCKSTNVVYVIHCQKCVLQYVEETEQALHEQINSNVQM